MNKLVWSFVLLSASTVTVGAENGPLKVDVHWEKITSISKLSGTVQLGPVPKDNPIRGQIMKALRDLGAEFVRYIPWYPDPKLAVAELYPPENGKTSWDFSLIDPPTEDFLGAITGHSFIMNFSTIPEWMFKTEKPVDPLKDTWNYEQGTELRDASLKELGDYYARLVSWYTQGGFTDENGKWHGSGHRFSFPYWEVLNEPELEHAITPERYTALYDAIVAAIQKVSPRTKFIGMALGFPMWEPKYFLYFLNHRNHRSGVPIDMVSYHFYAFWRPDQNPEEQVTTVFDQSDQLLDAIRYIQSIREQLSPETGTIIDEIGTGPIGWSSHEATPQYLSFEFRLSAAMYAYLYGQMAALGVDAAGLSALLGVRPGMFQELAMLDWKTGQPNIRYWGLKLLLNNLRPGDKLVSTSMSTHSSRWQAAYAQGFLAPSGARKLLLVNKTDQEVSVMVPGAREGRVEIIDETTGDQPARSVQLTSDTVSLSGLAVAVVTFP